MSFGRDVEPDTWPMIKGVEPVMPYTQDIALIAVFSPGQRREPDAMKKARRMPCSWLESK